MIPLSESTIQYIKSEVRKEYPKEAVFGVNADCTVKKLRNTHKDPENHFKINSKGFYEKGYVALIHSHTIKRGHTNPTDLNVDSRSPSECDMHTQLQMDVPWGILSADDTSVTDIIWFPDLDSDILGQPYISGVHDCYTLIQKYYWQNYKVVLDTVPHGPNWFTETPDLYDRHYADAGWVESSLKDIKAGDMILIRLFHNSPTHAAVYVGNDKIWHHMANRLSQEDTLSRWIKKASKILTYKGKPND